MRPPTLPALVLMIVSSAAAVVAAQPVTPPIQLEVLRHERELFGWSPAFELNVPNFGPGNRPFVRSRGDGRDETGFVHVLGDEGQWERRDFLAAVRATVPDFAGTNRAGGWNGARVAFDAAGDAYTTLGVNRAGGAGQRNVLLHSSDACRTWRVYDLPDGVVTMEHSPRPATLAGPPAVLVARKTREHPAAWADVYDLSLVTLGKDGDGGLRLAEPVLVTRDCFGISQHSGGATMALTRGDKVHVVWGETTDPDVKLPGSPTYVATFDRATGALGERVLLAHAPPANDAHNAPGIVADPDGFLHVVTGAHGGPFFHLRSQRPDDATTWTDPEPTASTGWFDENGRERARLTYLSLVCDDAGTLHIAYRQWIKPDPANKDYRAALSYQRKPKDGAWSAPVQLVMAPVTGYGIYYHKLALDRRGRVFLSYSYYNATEGGPYVSPDGSRLYRFRAMLASEDAGTTWQLPDTALFQRGMDP